MDKIVDVISEGPGIWYPFVKRGAYVQAGMQLGYVTDYFGKTILEARAPASGVVLHINAVPSLKKGDNIYNPRTRKRERVSRLMVIQGSERKDINEVFAGDIELNAQGLAIWLDTLEAG